MMRAQLRWWLITGLAALWLIMLVSGGGAVDRHLLLAVYASEWPWLALLAVGFTKLGDASSLLIMTLAAALYLLWRRRFDAALLLLAITLTGRVMVIMQKIWFARLRPEENLRLVEVSYLSFPSGHAANSTMVFLSIALFVLGGRRWTIILACALALLVGLSRPMLGVHWPSDVVGGWAFGALWVLVGLGIARHFRYLRNYRPREFSPRSTDVS
jgi:undecaprenyl-diphosphatase